MAANTRRSRWVSYLRVSTAEQAERELSLVAQRRAVAEFAERHGVAIEHEYVEPGASGTNPHRAVLNQLLGDALQPQSPISTIVVHHTSRFTRDATHARVAKAKLRRAGVRIVSVSQDLPDDPMGKLMEGLFECIDQYESELNGIRTSAAMREAVRQGYYPGGRAPFGYRSVPVAVRGGVVRHQLELDESEAQVVRAIYRLYVCDSGAKGVARKLNQLGYRMRSGRLWSKDAVLWLLDQSAASGTLRWGRCRRGAESNDGPSLVVPPIVDRQTYELAQELRARREPSRSGGRSAAKPHLLTGNVRCGRCGASYQLETSGKRANGTEYRYCYYNCRRSTRSGVEACVGYRIATDRLDSAVLETLANVVCSNDRVNALATRWRCNVERLRQAWRALLTTDPEVGRTYLLHLVERIEVHERNILVTPKPGGRIALARDPLDDTT